MDKEKKHFLMLCILTAAILSVLVTVYYGAVIRPEIENRSNEALDVEVEPEPETWTPELRGMYADSQPLEFLEYKPPRTLTINNESVKVEYIVVVMIPESMESRTLIETHTLVKIWIDDSILVGNKTKVSKVESEMAYVFADMNVSNDLYDRCVPFESFGIRVIEINLTSATFQADSTHRELQYNNDGNVTGVTEVTTIEGVAVHKVGIHTTDDNDTINPDNVSFYLTSPEVYDNTDQRW